MMPKTAILQLDHDQAPDRALVVGDPARAAKAAQMLTNTQTLSQVREYHCFAGDWGGTRVLVASHGVGGGGASICFEELIQAGVRTLIRAGTCGSFQPTYREGSLIIATGAVRNDGVSDVLVPPGYPAVADYRIVAALAEAAAQNGVNHGVGLCLTDGPFYPGVLGDGHRLWAEAGVLGVEMEVATLFIVAGLRGARAGAILNVDNYIFEREVYEPNREIVHQGTARMLDVALNALVNVEA